MVRFQWHVEDGLDACVGMGQLAYLRDHGVLQAMVECEIPGFASHSVACMTIPLNYNTDTGVRELGVLIAQGAEPSDWRSRLLMDLASTLARAGYLAVRYICHPEEPEERRVSLFDRVADVAASSPYARGVTRWAVVGMGSGGRVAALAGARLRSTVSCYAFLSYPLREPMHRALYGGEEAVAAAAAAGLPPLAPDSSAPLLRLTPPLLFVMAAGDPWINEAALMDLGPRLATTDVRCAVVQDVDTHFRTFMAKGPPVPTVRALAASLLDFLAAVEAYRMDCCNVQRVWQGAGGGVAGGAAADFVEQRPTGERPPLARPACFRPLPTGPPQPHAVQSSLATLQYVQAAQQHIQQRGAGAQTAAQLLAQQALLQQSAAQRRAPEQQAGAGPASLAAGELLAKLTATRGAPAGVAGAGLGGAGNAQLANLAHMFADPNAAAQLAAALLRQQHGLAAPAGAAGGGNVLNDALTSALVQRLAQQPGQQAGGAPGAPSALALQAEQAKLLAAAMNQQPGAGAGALTPQQLNQLLLQQRQLQQGGAAGAGAHRPHTSGAEHDAGTDAGDADMADAGAS